MIRFVSVLHFLCRFISLYIVLLNRVTKRPWQGHNRGLN